MLITLQAQKFSANTEHEEDELEEESLLESPLDKVEPYGYFKETLFSKSFKDADSIVVVKVIRPMLTMNPSV